MKKPIKTKKLVARREAIELFANNVKIDNKTVAEQIGVSAPTLRSWLSDPDFSDLLYKRYMEIAGSQIPSVIQSMIEEARLGNVQAGRLVLEHFGKLIPTIKMQVESNFEKFINAEDAEFSVISDEESNAFDLISKKIGTENIELPERDISNDNPFARQREENSRIELLQNAQKSKKTVKEKQNNRYLIRKRAKAVGLDLLPPGRHSRSARNAWLRKLEQLENEK